MDDQEIKKLLVETLMTEAQNELVDELLKRKRRAEKKKAALEAKVVYDPVYKLLPESSESVEETGITVKKDKGKCK